MCGVFRNAQHAVLPAHPRTVGPDMTFRASAENELSPGKEQVLALRLSANDPKLYLHVGSCHHESRAAVIASLLPAGHGAPGRSRPWRSVGILGQVCRFVK